MTLLIIYLLLTMGISFLCSLLESVLMSTPLSYLTMKEDEGDKNAALFLKFNMSRNICKNTRTLHRDNY
jgi:hypothetical protein